jgi:hypothetical protein
MQPQELGLKRGCFGNSHLLTARRTNGASDHLIHVFSALQRFTGTYL